MKRSRWADLVKDEKETVQSDTKAKKQKSLPNHLKSTTPNNGKPLSVQEDTEFEMLEKISEGTYGSVWKAINSKTKEIVAIKQVTLEKQQFIPITSLRECHLLFEHSHPNILKLHQVQLSPNKDQIWMVMQYMDMDLKHLMQKMSTGFLFSEIKTILLQILSGLSHLHRHLIVHRDLKTSNILINKQGLIQLADFGMARKLSPDMTPLVCTLWYRAPELLLGDANYNQSVDMWSVGCLMGELIQHFPLFDGTSEISQLQKIFELLGTPDEKDWPNIINMPHIKQFNFKKFPKGDLNAFFEGELSQAGLELIQKFLQFDPDKRISADDAIAHSFFKESPFPKPPEKFSCLSLMIETNK